MPDFPLKYQTIGTVPIPPFLYGTSRKEDETARLVLLALNAGFRGIDTANQRKHYHEAAVGEALREHFESGIVHRADLFLQTKFTFQNGQDERLPYDPMAAVSTQVHQSFESSLTHLGVETVDSYLLHAPQKRIGLTADDLEAWEAIESLQRQGRIQLIGVSNFTADQLTSLIEQARVAPQIVQNRCYAARGWDRRVRAICKQFGIAYQGFSLISANRRELRERVFRHLATLKGRTVPQIVLRFCHQIGILWLSGTKSLQHMSENLDIEGFSLTNEQIRTLEQVSQSAGQ